MSQPLSVRSGCSGVSLPLEAAPFVTVRLSPFLSTPPCSLFSAGSRNQRQFLRSHHGCGHDAYEQLRYRHHGGRFHFKT